VSEETQAQEAEETAALDNLLEKLRNGDNVGRRARRARPSVISTREPTLPSPDNDMPPASALGGTTADIARGMLEQLKTNGFVSDTFAPLSPTIPSAPRRRRLRTGNLAGIAAELEAAGSPLSSPPESPGIYQGLFSSTYEDGSDTR
jgi:cytokinesis protein